MKKWLRNRNNTWTLTLIAALAGGVLPTYTKISLETMSDSMLTIARYVYTFIVLVILAYVKRDTINWQHVRQVLPVSVFGAVNAICFAMGVRYIQAASIQLLYTVIPIMVAALSWVFLRQRTTISKIIGLIIGLSGVAMVAISTLKAQHSGFTAKPIGLLAVLIGAVSFSIYTVLSKPAQDKATPTDMLLGVSVSTVLSQFIYALCTNRHSLTIHGISLRSFLASLVVGLIGTAFYYWLYQYIVKTGSPLIASVTLYVLPLAGALIAFLVLGQHVSGLAVLGGLIALIGVAQVNGVWSRLVTRVKR